MSSADEIEIKRNTKRWLYCCLFIFLSASCKTGLPESDHSLAYKKTDSVKAIIQTGDIIVRNGTDEVSMATRKFNRQDTTYSHCGILQIENDTIFVYHALGGSYNPSQTLMRQVLDSFCNPKEVDKFAIYRYRFSPEQNNQFSKTIRQHFANRLPFDMFFNYDTDDKMYCSEFVFKSINTVDSNYLMSVHPRTNPMYITVDDLYLNPKTQLIKKVNF